MKKQKMTGAEIRAKLEAAALKNADEVIAARQAARDRQDAARSNQGGAR